MRISTSVAGAVVLALMLLTGAQTPARAQGAVYNGTSPATDGIDPALLTSLAWRSVGPARGGRSQAVAGSGSRPLEYYFGATGGGLWKTTDGGVTWRAVSDKFFKSSTVGAVAVSESNPDVVYVGMFTRYIVELDSGGELTVVRQNLETSSQDALESRGRRVRLEWRAEHTFEIQRGGKA